MSLSRIHNFSISLDGFGTGEPQSADAPFGHAGERLHEWMFHTRFWDPAGAAGVDDVFAERHSSGVGAEIMGAGKFGPPGWQDDPDWEGWWGPNPPFHTPTFVLTHRPRPPIEMDGGTTFHFLNAAPGDALEPPAKPPMARTSASEAAPASYAAFRRAPRRPHASRPGPDRARTRRPHLGRPRGPPRCLRRRSGLLAQRRHPPHLHARCRLMNAGTDSARHR